MKLTNEYCNKQLQIMFENEEDIKNTISLNYMYDEDKDIYIAKNPDLFLQEEFIERLKIKKENYTVFFFLVKKQEYTK